MLRQGNYSRDLVLFDDFMRKGKKAFPSRFEAIAETILRNEIKKEQFESFIEKAFNNDKNNSKNITAVGFINSIVVNKLKKIIGIDISENITIGLESYLLNGAKSKRHLLKGEALTKEDAKKYIIKGILDGDIYLQTDNNNILYLYQVEENKYLQIAVNTKYSLSHKSVSIKIPLIRNIQFLNDKQVTSKYINNKLLEVIK